MGIDGPRVAVGIAGVAGAVGGAHVERVLAVGEIRQLEPARAEGKGPAVERAREATDTGRDGEHGRVCAREREDRAGRVGRVGRLREDRRGRVGVVDFVDGSRAVQTAVELVANDVNDRVVVDGVELDRSITGRRGSHGIDGRAAGHTGDRGQRAEDVEAEVGRVDAGHRFAVGDRPGDRRVVRRAGVGARDREDRGRTRVVVDGVVGRGGGRAQVAGRVDRGAGRDRGDDGSVAGRDDADRVRGAGAGDRDGAVRGRAGDDDVGLIEVGDRLAEDNVEDDRAGIGRIDLATALLDR